MGDMAATARGPLTPRLMPTMAMEAMVDMDSAMEATAMAVLAMATARGLPTPRLMPTTAMEAMVDTVSATPLATVLATDTAVMERGPLILRPMPTTAMAAMVDMDSATVDTAMAVLATAMARGLLRPSLTMDTVELTPDMGMVDTDLVLAMATASKHRSNGSYPEVPRLMQGTATTNICHILNFESKELELCLLN